MNKHTPGPWVVRKRETYPGHVHEGFFKIDGFTAKGEQEYRVASVIDGNDSPQNESNARLIAAAPDLLEALQDVVNSVARCTSGDVCQMSDFSSARAAIAKATGES